jgi:translation initiation factor 2B subunit (eIF-2B alpha/beta/delta family)
VPDAALHPAVETLVHAFRNREVHAATSGGQVIAALAAVISASRAETVEGLLADIEPTVDAVLDAALAYAPPINAMHLLIASLEEARDSNRDLAVTRSHVAETAHAYDRWASRARSAIAENALNLIPDDGVVFTFTLSETVLAVLQEARRHKTFRVVVTESLPNGDGRITARALAELSLDVDVALDAGVAEAMRDAMVALIGTEAILFDGSAVCKVGTYPAALAARQRRVPVYVLCDTRKLYPESLEGLSLHLDPLRSSDIGGTDLSDRASVSGHLFDVTPPDLISGALTERGLVHPCQVAQWMLEMPMSRLVSTRLRERADAHYSEAH